MGGKAGVTSLPDFKTYYLAAVTKTAVATERAEPSRTQNPQLHMPQAFDKVAKAVWWRKGNLFKKQCWENWTSIDKKMKLNLNFTPSAKVDSDNTMVNFMCQIDWTTRYPAIWSNLTLGTSVRGYLMRQTFQSGGWVKQVSLPSVGGSHPISWKPGKNLKTDLPPRKRSLFLSDERLTRTLAIFLASGLELKPQLFLSLQLAKLTLQILDYASFQNHGSQCLTFHTHVYSYLLLVLVFWRTEWVMGLNVKL